MFDVPILIGLALLSFYVGKLVHDAILFLEGKMSKAREANRKDLE